MRKTRYVIAALVAGVAATVAFAAVASAQPNRKAADSIHGAGATFPAPLIAVWQQQYKGGPIQYDPIGSGGGIPADHGAHGRLRGVRRADDLRPVHGLQRLRP